MKTTEHYSPTYFVNPTHPITVSLIGCGGTGSHMLTKLAQLHYSLTKLDHPGLQVIAYDHDEVSWPNVGRQAFLPSDIGLNKAQVLISRINRAFGLSWEAIPDYFDTTSCNAMTTNIMITCIDSGKGRLNFNDFLKKQGQSYIRDLMKPYYWLDLGNSQHTGQAVLGTIQNIPQPKKQMANSLPNIVDFYPNIAEFDKEDKPSCSVAESLSRQDLCINAMMAEWGKKLLWSLFKDTRIQYQGVYVNLTEFLTNPIPILKKRPTS